MAERTRSPGGSGVRHPDGSARTFATVAVLAVLVAACGEDESKDDAEDRDADFSQSGLGFSHLRGYYDEPFELEITHPDANEVAYTLDCSDPRDSSTAVVADLPLTLRVDPDSTTGRFTSPAYIVRAFPLGEDDSPGRVSTHTYLFPGRVADLSPDGEAPGPEWPDPGEGPGNQEFDYGMDPDVTEAPEYASQIEPALRAIPSVSLCTDLTHLFDPNTGIYVNAREHGDEWERPTSFEILQPDASRGTQANAGLRIRGGYSRDPANPKHAFRLFFRSDYGPGKLEYELFGSEGTDRFDKVDLRTAQNYSWSFDNSPHNTMVREVFSRDLQRELGRPYTRSRYYHLYLSGVYWGLFQSQERSEARYAVSYFGSEVEDYDVVKVDTDADYVIEATDGDTLSWEEVWQRCQQGFESDADYYALEGRDASGARDPSQRVWVDIDNLIDYMLVVFYTGNYDGPVSKFYDNSVPNNFYGIFNRADPNQGFIFFAHDNEHSLHFEPVLAGDGVDENRVNIGESGVQNRMVVNEFSRFHPQWLHYRLSANANYRARFAARAQQLLAGGGPMTGPPGDALFRARAGEIQVAIIAESARWGDAQRGSPFTKDDHWTPEIETVLGEWFPARTAIVVEQLRDLDLCPQ